MEDRARVHEAFEALANFSRDINAATDHYTDQILVIERVVNSLNIGLKTHERIEDGIFLVYQRFNSGVWGFAIEWRLEHDHEILSIAQAPRWIRIAALDHIAPLLERMAKNAEKTIKKLQACTIIVQDVLNKINEGKT